MRISVITRRSKGIGTYMVVDVEDEEGTEARMVAHNAFATKFHPIFIPGTTNKVSKFAFKIQNLNSLKLYLPQAECEQCGL